MGTVKSDEKEIKLGDEDCNARKGIIQSFLP